MNILVVNCGSSSLKFQLIDSETEQVSASGNCERIGLDGKITYKAHGDKFVTETDLPEHGIAIKKVLELLVDKERGVINSLDEIHAVGHRMVHGGEKFSSSVVITEDVIKDIESCNDLAPLHNPANILGVRACQEISYFQRPCCPAGNHIFCQDPLSFRAAQNNPRNSRMKSIPE